MNGAVKVLVVIGQLESGGTERHLLQVLPALQSDSIHCTVYALRGGGALQGAMEAAGVPVISPRHHSRRWLGLLRTARHFLATLRAERPEVLHFFLPEAYLLGGLCSLIGPRCARIMSRRSLNLYQRKRFMSRAIEGFLHRRMDCVLANSDAVLMDLAEEGVADSVAGLIYNGVALPPASDAGADARLRHELGFEADLVVLVMVANLIPYKGHADVIEALRLARDQMPDKWIILMIGGDTGIQEDLVRQAVAAGVARSIRWLGTVDDVQAYLSIADLAVTASHEEGFSNAILEAMAASRAQVVTAVGGNAEAVIDGESGFVVTARDPDELARAIVELAGDAELRMRFGQAAHARAAAEFAMERCIASYRRVYLSVAQGERAPIKEVIGRTA